MRIVLSLFKVAVKGILVSLYSRSLSYLNTPCVCVYRERRVEERKRENVSVCVSFGQKGLKNKGTHRHGVREQED